MSALFSGQEAAAGPDFEPSLTRAGHGISYRSDTYCYTLLNVDTRNKRMNPTHMVVYARSSDEFPDFSRHEGEEFVYVLAGTLEVHFETGKVVTVKKAIAFTSTAASAISTFRSGRETPKSSVRSPPIC